MRARLEFAVASAGAQFDTATASATARGAHAPSRAAVGALANRICRRKTHSFFLLFVVLCAAFTGCSTVKPHLPEPHYKPNNVFYKAPVLDPQIRRVAILPLATSVPSEALQAGIDLFQPLLSAEIDKTKRFELTIVTPVQLRQLSGHPSWKVDDQLPSDFFERIHEATGCDAVFFAELTRYSAYPPIVVGWKLTLVQVSPHDIIWAADEVFDSGDAAVEGSARQYSSEHIHVESPVPDPGAILGSPSRFGQYSLHALLTLLPLR